MLHLIQLLIRLLNQALVRLNTTTLEEHLLHCWNGDMLFNTPFFDWLQSLR